MRGARYSRSRQRVCDHCSAAKVRCDRTTGSCRRCSKRRLKCTFPEVSLWEDTNDRNDATLSSDPAPVNEVVITETTPIDSIDTFATPSSHNHDFRGLDHVLHHTSPPTRSVDDAALRPPNNPASNNATPQALDFSKLDLICPINANDVCNRWLNVYVPDPGQKSKNYPPAISAFIHQILKSYAMTVIQGEDIPPFVHDAQLKASTVYTSLLTCLTLVRVFRNPLPGSTTALADILLRVMKDVYDEQSNLNTNMLACFQAYLIYTMVLFFEIDSDHCFLPQAMMNLQNIASACCKEGVVCIAELNQQRPTWESWIVAEAKRRTLYVMYLLDSVLSTRNGLPTMLGTELSGLPAAGPKKLWQAQSRQDWDKIYNLRLNNWSDGDLKIDELWPIPDNFDEPMLERRRQRIDRWLVDLDEFGVMLYAVTSCTHGH